MSIAVGLVVAPVVALGVWFVQTGAVEDAAARPTEEIRLLGSDDEGSDEESDEESTATTADGLAFDLEIDPELDARFGPRAINAVDAAEIVVDRFGGRVVEAELDEEAGRPIWEIKLAGGAVSEVDVDATTGDVR